MKDYTTLIFDAFDTVVHIDRAKLPACKVAGQQIRTTAPAVHSAYIQQFGDLDFDVFYSAFSQSATQLDTIRKAELVEVPSQERFALMLRLLGHDLDNLPGQMIADLIAGLTGVHMNSLQNAFEVRPETLQFLEWAESRFRRAMISNFDYAPGLYNALDRFGIRQMFEIVTVSIEVGWRKPHPIIFQRTLECLGIQPLQALFIGDQLDLDVLGATQSGIDVAWLDSGCEAWTPQFPEPTYRVGSITKLIDILEKQ